MKRNEDEDEDGDKQEDEGADEDGDLSCTTVLLLVSIADEEGGQDEAPAIPGISHHHNHWFNHSQNHIHPYHHLHGAPPNMNICWMQLYLLVREGFHLEGVGPVI